MSKTLVFAAVAFALAGFFSNVLGAQRPADNPAGAGPGLAYKFYSNSTNDGALPNFSAVTPASVGVINNFLFQPNGGNSNFAFVYTGYISIPTAGVWTFYTLSDDGSALYIGKPGVDEVKINPGNEGAHIPQETSGTIDLAAGLHAIKVEFAQGLGGYQLQCSMAGPGMAKMQIPDTSLYTVTPAPIIVPADSTISTPTFSMSIMSAAGSTVYYTTDGTTPTAASAIYINTVTLAPPLTVKAIAKLPGYDFSAIATQIYGSPIPPPNNNFANALLLSGNLPITVNGSNANATWEAGEPNHGDGNGQKSIWYRWVPAAAGSYVFSTTNSSIDTTLGVYTGSAVNALVKIGDNDDATGDSVFASPTTSSAVAITVSQAQVGTTFFIAIDGFAGAEGATSLTLSAGPTLAVTATSPNASEAGPASGVFTILRTGNMGSSFTANFDFDGTATRGLDYKRGDTFVNFAAGQTFATVTVTPIDDAVYEGTETVILTLLPSNYYRIDPARTSATVNINDNDADASGVVANISFSVPRGFYSSPHDLALTTATGGASIRYTTDGSVPTLVLGTVYSGPIHLTGTTTIRAVAYKAGMNPSHVDTNTYIFTADVIVQQTGGQAPAGWPAPNGQGLNYGMDPSIVNPNIGHIQNDLRSIPSICMTMNLSDLFDASTGIYVNAGSDGIAWERPCNLEMIDASNAINNWGEPCGVRIRGAFSRSTSNPKHAFRFFFRKDYGKGTLEQPLFGPSPAQQKIDTFDLRTFQNYSWSFQGDRANFCALRDVFSRDTQLAMSGFGCRGDYYHLYINGIYFGLFNTDERGEASWAANSFGGDKNDYDVIKSIPDGPNGYSIYATDGTMDAWTRLWKACKGGLSTNAAYFRIQGKNADGTPNATFENLIEIDDLIDYMLVIYYGGNLGGPISNFLSNSSPDEMYGSRNRNGNAGFRFTIHDAEHTLLNVNENRLGPWPAGSELDKSNPQWFFQQCEANPEFRIKLADHIRKHLFDNGTLTPAACIARFNARKTQIEQAIYCESARWGDSKTTPACNFNDWNNCCNNIIDNYFPQRTNIVINQFVAAGLYPILNAPNFSQYGGNISPGFVCTITNPQSGASKIYYTTDGSDPRRVGGAVNGTATTVSALSVPVTLNGTTTLRARVYDGVTWSAMTEATFTSPQDFTKLKVTEIMYNPMGAGGVDGQEFEFLEMKNTGTVALNLSGAQFVAGIQYAFPNGSVVNPGQFVVLAANPSAFAAHYPAVTPTGSYSGRLSNSGDTITLNHAAGTQIFSFRYNDAAPWPVAADGLGFSMVPKDPASNYSFGDPKSWRASTNSGGSPGADDPVNALGSILINEALTHGEPLPEYIELFNAGNSTVDISGWYLTDDRGTPQKYRIPNGTTMDPGSYLSISSTQYDPNPGVPPSFALDSHGEELFIFSASSAGTALTGYGHGFKFGAQRNGVSFGRHVISTGDEHFVRQLSQTPGAANSGPANGPLVIEEVMYKPAANGDEFIEVLNITENPVPLFDANFPANTWKISGVNYTFPTGITIAPNSLFVICGIDPSVFRAKYNVAPGIPIYGPWLSALPDNSGHFELQRPDNPDPLPGGGTFVPYVAMEILDYSNTAPWPVEVAGAGLSLQRKNPLAYGNDPINWQKSAAPGGSPGTSEPLAPPAPTNLFAIASSFDKIDLSWMDTTGETSYTLQRSPDGVSGWVSLPQLAANITSTQDIGLAPSTIYYYRIFASSGYGNSGYSNVASATTQTPPLPNPPMVLAANAVSQSTIALSWLDASDSEAGFKIERSPDGVNNWQQIGTTGTNVNTFSDQNLSASTLYYYRVRAYNITGDSAYSNAASATTLARRDLGGHAAAVILGGHTASVFIELNSAGGEQSVAFSLGFDSALFGNSIVIPDASLGANVSVTSQSSPAAVGITVNRADGTAFSAGIKALVEIRFNTVAAVDQPTNTAFVFGDTPTARATLNAAAQALETSYSAIPATIAPNQNHNPVAQDTALAVNEDEAKSGTLVATDADNDPLTYSIVTRPLKGVVTITDAAAGAFTYTPAPLTFGSDSFTFKATDGLLESNVGVVSVTIKHLNHPPIAQNKSLATLDSSSISGTLIATDLDGEPLTFRVVTDGAKGKAIVIASTGAFTYTPDGKATGTDSFTFVASDGIADSAPGTVLVTINPTAVTITSPEQAAGNVRENFQFAVTTTGTQPISIEATGLPQGLTLANGAIAGVPAAAGKYPVVITASNGVGSQTQLLTITIVNIGGSGNKPPHIVSGPTASQNPVRAGEAVSFTASATDDNGDQLEFNWTLGDGTADTGPSLSHVYNTPGTYVVTLTVSDGAAGDTKTLLLAVNAAGSGAPNALAIKKAQVALKFNAINGDTATITGFLPVSVDSVALRTQVTVFLGGKASAFTLDINGRGGSAKQSLRLSGVKKGIFTSSLSAFAFGLKKASLADTLKPFGLINASVTKPVVVPVAVMIGGVSYTSDVPMLYKGKAGKTGSAKK